MLRVDGLRVRYGAIEAVHGASFEVREGEVVALIGANGAGKSSTLGALSGLVHVAGGHVVFDGRDVTNAAPHEIVRMGIVQVPEGREILARMSVEENLLLGAAARPAVARARSAPSRSSGSGQPSRETLASVMERFPILAERRALLAGSLSGGEQQILAIARALLASPRLLLLDEPSLGLAPKMVVAVFEILADLKARGTTMLLVEQNALRALRLADRAYVMEVGRITLAGTGAELLANDAVARAYLGA